jgi:hypothetical protein
MRARTGACRSALRAGATGHTRRTCCRAIAIVDVILTRRSCPPTTLFQIRTKFGLRGTHFGIYVVLDFGNEILDLSRLIGTGKPEARRESR